MTKEFLYMQFLSGVITEGEYKAKLAESQSTKKTDLNENFVGIGAINNPFAEREKTDYEMAFDHFMTQLDEKKDKPSSDLTKKEKSAIAKKTKEKNIKEAEGEEDTIDTITMDVPLFIRMLEYAREDASQDVDLHDVTAKAVELNKDMDVLTMDSYDSIVGDDQIEEGIHDRDITSTSHTNIKTPPKGTGDYDPKVAAERMKRMKALKDKAGK